MVCGGGQRKHTTTKTERSWSILKVVRGGDQGKPTPKNEHLCSFLEVVDMWWLAEAHNPRNRAQTLNLEGYGWLLIGGGQELLISGGVESQFGAPNASGEGGGTRGHFCCLRCIWWRQWGVFLL